MWQNFINPLRRKERRNPNKMQYKFLGTDSVYKSEKGV